ncbi:hypothetical protein [Hyphococcus sp.]|jgi:hypothetical protein|uniref:hypothetical protein n=1 Tax=Hyphococcus sp. TaxID=2038636 RepID=UPI003D11E66C
MKFLRLLKLAALSGAMAALTSGCWYHAHYRHGPAPVRMSVSYIRVSPPPPRRIIIPPRPSPAAIWINGYWRWTGADYVWIDGFWEHNPPRHKTWRDGRWVHTSQGWYWVPGRWD